MITDFFAYGTLMSEAAMSSVTGCRFTGTSACLRGYRRSRVRGEAYPGMVAKAGHAVVGILYRNVTETAWKRLDAYEDRMYRRKTVAVEMECGAIVRAQTYVIRKPFEDRLTREAWGPEDSSRTGLRLRRRGKTPLQAARRGRTGA